MVTQHAVMSIALFPPNYGHGSFHEGILRHKLEGMFKIAIKAGESHWNDLRIFSLGFSGLNNSVETTN